MRREDQTSARADAQIRRRILVRQCVCTALLAVCGIVLMFQPNVPKFSAGMIIGAGVVGVVLFGGQLLNASPNRDKS
ncbi:hypothetical protein [Prescottella agglutinans]|uniref:Drug/metabolite transporter (DMT)-like permease n=1 Tax=Prescottella agglutinans TaxID=1644129 RepID=A0ABT6MIZ8_9NOCA|nr:hypothetical protein [Prescottella agglutinans]MDH6284298.1 drug/metabolite transporter (DMT)-like permease [Prescottella agglutinans]